MKNQPRKAEIVPVNSAQAVVLLLSQWNALDRIEPMQKKLNEANPTEKPTCLRYERFRAKARNRRKRSVGYDCRRTLSLQLQAARASHRDSIRYLYAA